MDEPDREDWGDFLTCNARRKVRDGHGDGAQTRKDDTFFEDATVIFEMRVMRGDGKGNADEGTGNEEELKGCYLLFPQENAESHGDREFQAHDRLNDCDLPLLESLEIKECCEEGDDGDEPQERDFLDCEMLEVRVDEGKEGNGAETSDAEERFPCANEARRALNKEVPKAPAEECSEGEEDAEGGGIDIHVSWFLHSHSV